MELGARVRFRDDLSPRDQRRRRAPSNSSISKVLSGVRRVLKQAQRRRYVDYNVLDDPDCFLRVKAPNDRSSRSSKLRRFSMPHDYWTVSTANSHGARCVPFGLIRDRRLRLRASSV